ncbi:MAG: alpha/beta hydrolase [Anaerolineales bacterium]
MTIHTHTLESAALRGNRFNDPTTRALHVYTPPDYDPARRYPALYLLASHGNTGESLLNWRAYHESLPARLDRLMGAEGVPPALVVLPDTWTALGSSQYLNSTIGNYEDYLLQDVIPFVEAHYPADPAARGVLGHSSGGYGAIVQAMRHPEIFQAVASHAGDMYFEYTCLPLLAKLHQNLARFGGAAAFLADVAAVEPKGGAFWETIMALCWAMAHASNPQAPLGFDMPIDETTGALREDVWQRWLAFDPLRILETLAAQEALRGMAAVYLSAGAYDEYQAQVGARLFSRRLNEVGIPHTYEEPPTGHSGADVPYDASIRLLAAALSARQAMS